MELRKIKRFAALAAAVVVVAGGLAASAARADVQLNRLFSPGAVLQQGMKVPIFGTASAGEEVTVALQTSKATTVADADGNWEVQIGPLQPGGPFTMIVTAGRTLSVNNVMVGEVWVCAGGSNMQYPLLSSEGGGAAVINSLNQQLRLYMIKREGAKEPRDELDVPWIQAGAASIGGFSGVGYFFGRTLAAHLEQTNGQKVPIGLIGCNIDRSSIESWISKEALEGSPTLKGALDKPISTADTRSPTVVFNGMVNPLTRYAVRGVIWYHGEGSLDEAYPYREALATLIADWRKRWNNPQLPFLIVQLTSHKVATKMQHESKLAELRESQFLTAKQMPHTALVVTTDYGDPILVHPREKEPIGRRVALAARGLVYGEKIEYTGPLFNSVNFNEGRAELRFLHVGAGLTFKGGEKDGAAAEAKGFFIAASDRVFHPAKAVLEGDTVVVTSTEVRVPKAVRYGWADFPTGNLCNKEGLPASPFRTDNFPLLTTPQAE